MSIMLIQWKKSITYTCLDKVIEHHLDSWHYTTLKIDPLSCFHFAVLFSLHHTFSTFSICCFICPPICLSTFNDFSIVLDVHKNFLIVPFCQHLIPQKSDNSQNVYQCRTKKFHMNELVKSLHKRCDVQHWSYSRICSYRIIAYFEIILDFINVHCSCSLELKLRASFIPWQLTCCSWKFNEQVE